MLNVIVICIWRRLVSSEIVKLRTKKSGLILSLSLPFPLCSVVRDLSHFSSPTLMSPSLKNLVPVHKRDKASDVSLLWTFIAQNSKRSGSLLWNFHGLHSSGQSGPSQGLFVFPHLQVLTEMSLSSFEAKKKVQPWKVCKMLQVEHLLTRETMFIDLVALWNLVCAC